MKISDFRNEDALDLLADLIEPAAHIFSDKQVEKAYRDGDRIGAIKHAIKDHKTDVIAIVAALDGTTPDKCDFDAITLLSKILEILSDQELVNFFGSQGRTEEKKPSGSATASTRATRKTSKASSATQQ